MNENWESEIAALLSELADVQSSLLVLLSEKRQMLATGNHEGLAEMAGREQHLLERLQDCLRQRQQLLARAYQQGIQADSIGALSQHLSPESRDRLHASIRQTADRTRLLQHQSLTNWVLVQRTLLHLSQMMEIIATGGRLRPTYGNGPDRAASGALVDQAV